MMKVKSSSSVGHLGVPDIELLPVCITLLNSSNSPEETDPEKSSKFSEITQQFFRRANFEGFSGSQIFVVNQ